MKTKRQEAILQIITDREVTTQEGLQAALRERGFDVTQATVSRDIKSLDLVKVITPEGRYRYSQKQRGVSGAGALKFRSVFVEAVIHVDCAQNIVVIKCHVGMGNAACAAIDTMELEGVVGTLAGDDTVFILMRSGEQAVELMQRLQEMVGQS